MSSRLNVTSLGVVARNTQVDDPALIPTQESNEALPPAR
jgi:hypothetical protein